MTVEITSLAELEHFENMDESVILYGATWCGPCKQFKPTFIKASGEFTIPFGVVYIDTLDDADEGQIVTSRDIMTVPTVRYHRSGAIHDLKERRPIPFIKELTEAIS